MSYLYVFVYLRPTWYVVVFTQTIPGMTYLHSISLYYFSCPLLLIIIACLFILIYMNFCVIVVLLLFIQIINLCVIVLLFYWSFFLSFFLLSLSFFLSF